VSSREGYDNSLRVPMEYFADLSETDRSAIFGDTARAIWQLPDDLPVVTA
jgi:predicted TIM-barrel fold metal-dependent hydrolase